jgi:hypothetical protein
MTQPTGKPHQTLFFNYIRIGTTGNYIILAFPQ